MKGAGEDVAAGATAPLGWTGRLLLGGILVLAFLAYRSVLGLEHMGWDTWPMILSSRIQGMGDLAGTFTEELMDGRYPLGHFFRPVANLSFALDHALWGLEPFGYHLTDLLILGASTILVLALGRRLLGTRVGSLSAAFVFALHPAHFEALPVSARRADTLAVLFVLAALVAQPRATASPRRLLLGGLLALCAAAAKETGVLVVAIVFALHWLEAPERGLRGRALRAVRRSLPALAAVLLFVLGRTAVLGGLGGHADSSISAGLTRGPGLLLSFAPRLLQPQPISASGGICELHLWAVAAGACAALALVLLLPLREPRPIARRASGGALFLLAWLILLLEMTGISGEEASWYAVPFLPAYALLLGVLADCAHRAARERRWLVAALPALVVAALLAQHLRFSGLLHDYPSWGAVSRAEGIFLDRLEGRIRAARGGTSIEIRGLPSGLVTREGFVGVRSAAGMSGYSVQAWAELAFPDREIRVGLGATPARSPSEIGVGLFR